MSKPAPYSDEDRLNRAAVRLVGLGTAATETAALLRMVAGARDSIPDEVFYQAVAAADWVSAAIRGVIDDGE